MSDNFDELGINETILRGVYAYGFEKPSHIQVKAIPHVISGKDLVAQAQSGTGKTGAFSIGALSRIDDTKDVTQLLILTPTRELAEQVFNVVKEISSYTKIRVARCVGGTNVSMCGEEMRKNPQVVIGTPGRVIDMLNRRHLVTSGIQTLVLDEADEMLSFGFKDDMYTVIQNLKKEAQICLFSATLPPEILEMTQKFMNDPVNVLVKQEELTLEGIQQFYVNVNHSDWKYDVIVDLYDTINVNQCIIYINSRQRIVDIYQKLCENSFPVEYITGERSGPERTEIMEKFRAGQIRILLASDLLARGIDVQQLSLVINYDLPKEKETYIHRIGRSGRYGRKGVAINLICDRDVEYLKHIESFYDTKIDEMPANIADIIG
jgi:translation initiation factor 4A